MGDLTLAQILDLETEQGLRPDDAELSDGLAWCNDPECPDWHRGNDGCYWNHVHG